MTYQGKRKAAREASRVIRKMCFRGKHCWCCEYRCHNCGERKPPPPPRRVRWAV